MTIRMFKNPYFSSILVPFKTNEATEHFLREAFIFLNTIVMFDRRMMHTSGLEFPAFQFVELKHKTIFVSTFIFLTCSKFSIAILAHISVATVI